MRRFGCGPLKVRQILETPERRRGTYFPRAGERFGAWYPGTPVYTRHKRRSLWLTNWPDAIRRTNERMVRK